MRRRRATGAVLVAVLGAACTGSPSSPTTTLQPPTANEEAVAPTSSAPSPTPVPTPSVSLLPKPDEPIPGDAKGLAEALTETTDALREAVEAWTGDGDPSRGGAPDDVLLRAMYQQRIYRTLGRHPELADRTIGLLPRRLRGEARADAGAAEDLSSLVAPISTPVTFHTGKPKPAGVLRAWFEEAEKRFGVRWQLLAAVMFVESRFGRVRASSSAGAQGPMQFLPGTWAAYGMGGDVHDPHDAILGAANYLHSSGAPANERAALFAYNHADAYVDAVLAYANQMAGDDRDYYAFYNWQVYVLTKAGDKRLTGPGL
jgi:Transglycosylase SLT domain